MRELVRNGLKDSKLFLNFYLTLYHVGSINPLSANPTKRSNTLKTVRRQFADELLECV